MPANTDEYLAQLALAATRTALAHTGLMWPAVDSNACAALRFCRLVDDRPTLVGLIGGASSGKSTVFNAMIGREVSQVSAHAHETLGAIVAVHEKYSPCLQRWISEELLFCGLDARPITQDAPTVGAADAVHIRAHTRDELEQVLLCDLPDVTSKSSADEGAITLQITPFLDALIVVVDEERWFDAAVFEGFLTRARAFGPRVFVVFNRTEQNAPLANGDRARLADVAERHFADGCCVSAYQPGCGYRPVSPETGATLAEWMRKGNRPGRRESLAGHIRQRCSAVVGENVARAERHAALVRAVDLELQSVAADTSLTLDLLTAEERGLLGLGHRFLPLYDLARQVGRRLQGLAGRPQSADIDFDKSSDALADVLRRNLELRFGRATARIDERVAASDYLSPEVVWESTWTQPALDAEDWSRRIRAHIDAWKQESRSQSRRGDIAAVGIGTPLLLADLLFLGGAGVTVAWAAAWVAGFLGGKGIARLMQRSPAYAAYQTTVKAYQALLRESLAEQWTANLERMPRRHLRMSDPILAAMLHLSTPGRAS